MADLPGHGFHSVTMQLEQPIDSSRLETSLRHIMALYGDQLVRLKGLIFDPAFDHSLLIQGSVGVLYPPAHLPARKSDDFISRRAYHDGRTQQVSQ